MVIESAIGGMPITTLIDGRERYPLRVRYAQDFRSDPQALEEVLISAPGGVQVPLGDLAKVEVVEGPPIGQERGRRLDGDDRF